MDNPIPVTVYDLQVLCYKIHHLVEKEENALYTGILNRLLNWLRLSIPVLEGATILPKIVFNFRFPDTLHYDQNYDRKTYIKMLWAYLLNRGALCADYEPHTAIIVDDNGFDTPYWRKEFFPEYKGNRKPKPPALKEIHKIGLNYILSPNSPLHYFSVPGYEADDIAGTLVYIKRQCQAYGGDPETTLIANRQINLYTVDSDWLQLVGNGVTWFNTGIWKPQVRDVKETLQWFKKRHRPYTINHPEDIVSFKMKHGDSSDNLPPGTPRFMIDLMNQHPNYHLKDRPIYKQLWMALLDTKCNNNLDHLNIATNYFFRRGYAVPS